MTTRPKRKLARQKQIGLYTFKAFYTELANAHLICAIFVTDSITAKFMSRVKVPQEDLLCGEF